MSDISPEIVKTAAATLVAEGGAPGSSIHSWRCEHPERYGSCNCVTMTVEEILKAVEPLMRAEILRECHVGLVGAASTIVHQIDRSEDDEGA